MIADRDRGSLFSRMIYRKDVWSEMIDNGVPCPLTNALPDVTLTKNKLVKYSQSSEIRK